MTMKTTTAAAIVALIASAAPSAFADPPTPTPDTARTHGDFEVDPTAYALSGHSLHVGLGWGRTRLDLGNFAMTVPRAVHGQRDFDVSFEGYGVKLQRFLFREESGGFVGVDAAVVHQLTRLRGTELAALQTQVAVGVHGGYRFDLSRQLYASAWVGVGRSFGARDVSLGDKTFETPRWTVFPAVHLGYRFQ